MVSGYLLSVLDCGGGVGLVSLLLYFTGFLRNVRWNLVDGLVLILFFYSLVRLSFQEMIPQSSWIQSTFLAGTYGITRILWPSINRKSFQLLLSLLLLAGIAETGYGLGQLYGFWPSHHHLFPLTGSFFNPGPYSGWLACMVPVAVYGIIQNIKRVKVHPWVSYLSWSYLFLAVLVLFPAASRAAILGVVAGTVLVSWPRIKNLSLWQSKWFKVTLASGMIMGLAGLYLMKIDSADGRLLIYKITTDMIADAPILGWGWDGFPLMYNNYQAVYFENGYGNEREKYLANNVIFGYNEFLEFTAEMGMLGLLLVAGLVILLVRKWRELTKKQSIQPFHYLGLSVLLAWTVFALFSYPMSIPALAILLPVTLSGFNTAFNKKSDLKESAIGVRNINAPVNISLNILSGLILLGISIYGIYWVQHYRPLTKEWMSANANYSLQRYETANSLYNTLYSEFQNEGVFLQYAGKSHSLGRKFYTSGQLLERALFFSADPTIFTTLGKDYTLFSKVDSLKKERAEFLLTRVKNISPYKYYPRYLLTKYYQHTGKEQKALNEAKALLAITPKISSHATKEIKQEMLQLIDQEIFIHQEIVYPVLSSEDEN